MISYFHTSTPDNFSRKLFPPWGFLGWTFPLLCPVAESISAGVVGEAVWGWVEQLRSQEFPEILLSSTLGRSQSEEWSRSALEMWSSVPSPFIPWKLYSLSFLQAFSYLLQKFWKQRNKENPLNFHPAQEFILQTHFPCGFRLILTKSIEPLYNTTWILAIAGKTSSHHPGQLTLESIFGFPQWEFWAPDYLCAPVNLGILRTCFFLDVGNRGQHTKCNCHQNFAQRGPKSLLSSRRKARSLKVIIQCLLLVNYL